MTGEKRENVIRFAVMARSEGLQKWQMDSYNALINSGLAENVLWIIEDEEVAVQSWIARVSAYPWRKLIFRKYYKHFFKPESFKRISFDEVRGEIPVINCKTLRKGKYSEYFEESDLNKISRYAPDFILKFGFGIIKGEILTCTPYGVWSFHHGDEQKYRGVPPAFHEIMRNDPVTASILQRLTETLDGGVILRKGFFKTINHSWSANLDQALKLSLNWPLDVCREIISQKSFPAASEGVKTLAPVYKEPENLTMTQFLVKVFVNKIRFHFSEIFLSENWETGLVEALPGDLLESESFVVHPQKVTWLRAGLRNRYWADSFAIEHKNKLLLLFENYDYRKQKAEISATWFDENNKTFGEIKSALIEEWHLSYPFIQMIGDDIYCIPESMGHGSVELYKLDTGTLKLNHSRTLIPGLQAADGTLVYHQNHWYFFFTPAHATNTELHIWHSETLDGTFVPHTLTPVKSNAGNARPAGPFFTCDGKLYRPAQDSSRTYGGRIIINEIKLLTEDDFLEETVNVLMPPAGYSGIHNVSFAGKHMFFDSKKYRFSPAAFRHQIMRRLKL